MKDELSSGPRRDSTRQFAFPADKRNLVAAAIVFACLVIAAVSVVVALGSTNKTAVHSAPIRMVNENTIDFLLKGRASAELSVSYLQTGDQPSAWITVADIGLPRGYDYSVTAGSCANSGPHTLAQSSGIPDARTDVLLLSLGNMPGTERSDMWVTVATPLGAKLGGVRGPLALPNDQVAIGSGKPVCQ